MSRKRELKPKTPHILNEILEKDFKLDATIKSASQKVFDFDGTSRIILATLGINETLNEYQISKKSKIPITTVRRKLIGRESKSKTLKELECVFYSKGKVTIRNKATTKKNEKRENNYSLTLKGLFVSLAVLDKFPFEKNYLVNRFRKIIFDKFGKSYDMSYYVIQLIKYHIALFMLWHQVNGLELTRHKNLVNYFIEWNKSNFNLNINHPSRVTADIESSINFNEIRIRFFVLESIVSIFLKKLNANNLEFIWNEKGNSEADITFNSESYYDIIKFWPYYIENIQWSDFEPYHLQSTESNNLEVKWDIEEIDELQDKILSNLKIKNKNSISKQNLIWSS